jgi:hypothetical protein
MVLVQCETDRVPALGKLSAVSPVRESKKDEDHCHRESNFHIRIKQKIKL